MRSARRLALALLLLTTACSQAVDARTAKKPRPTTTVPVTTVAPSTSTTTTDVTTTVEGETTTAVETTTTLPGVPVNEQLGFTTLHRGSDEFDTLDMNANDSTANRWTAKTHSSFRGLSNFSLDGQGHLRVRSYKDSTGWHDAWATGKWSYTGPRYVEVRALVPATLGAFSDPLWECDYPYCELHHENDVIEQLAREPDGYHVNLHAQVIEPHVGAFITSDTPMVGEWHTIGSAVYDDRIDFYLDGVLRATITKADMAAAGLPWPYTNPQIPFVVQISQYAGGWGGTIDPAAAEMVTLIDWIHVWTPTVSAQEPATAST